MSKVKSVLELSRISRREMIQKRKYRFQSCIENRIKKVSGSFEHSEALLKLFVRLSFILGCIFVYNLKCCFKVKILSL